MHQPVACEDCRRLLVQLTDTRLHERRVVIAALLNRRVCPPKDEWDVVANATLESAAQMLADVRG